MVVYLSLGSNVGDRAGHLQSALTRIQLDDRMDVLRVSDCYETAPWGVAEQSPFVNIAAEIETAYRPLELLNAAKSIERDLGRRSGPRWGPRLVDIDIVLWGEMILETPELWIPHRHFHERRFVLEPLAQIAPDLRDPRSGERIADLARAPEATGAVMRMGPFGVVLTE